MASERAVEALPSLVNSSPCLLVTLEAAWSETDAIPS